MDLGRINRLRVDRKAPHGLYLMDDAEQSVLLPIKYVPEGTELDDRLEVFVYKDNEGRPIATTLAPKAVAGTFASLEVKDVNRLGCFLDLGVEKDLLLPYAQQIDRPQKGDQVVVRVLIDPKSERLIATQRVEVFLSGEPALEVKDEVTALIYQRTDLGFKAIVNNTYAGIFYHSEVFQNLRVGLECQAQVKKVRTDGKLDLLLQKMGYDEVDASAQRILDLLKEKGGFLPYHDKTDPEQIKLALGMSKKVFKKSVGQLYKSKRIELEDSGIRLI